ncbi:DUF1993 family protein [Pseudoalteromonas sp. S16_S37]|uniref:DUF1993 family protein n=1 Tax=Pseudoalteromonas sp. S16_S37 TaxID=2720228 RepID=UPI001681B792|nr:DUF1993 family protein [Pseudoalteromonas sp. S16_S37]MBD1584296.1 DUF1993 domain-containing protein [Pseudoalteromonas sp. S16_S37]
MTNPSKPFVHYLHRIKAILQHNSALEPMLHKALCDDMFVLHQQLTTAISFSLRCCCALIGRNVVSFKRDEASIDALIAEIDDTLGYLNAMSEQDFVGYEQQQISFEAGFAHNSLSGADFVVMYALPNFIFHYSVAYAILRSNGLALGKADFDGFHHYPAGFSFLTPSCHTANLQG